MSDPLDEFIIYKPWPLDQINQELTEFNRIMHDGADVEELEAGLHGLDFICRASELDANTQARLDGATTEAEMRISLLLQQRGAGTEELISIVKKLHNNFRRIEQMLPIWAELAAERLREKHGLFEEDDLEIEP